MTRPVRALPDALKQDIAAAKAASPEPTAPQEIDPNTLGHIVWHSTEEDGGPDVGMSLGLGGDKAMWVGEITNEEWDELDPGQRAVLGGGSGGTFLMLYPDRVPLARFTDMPTAQDFIEAVAAAIQAAKRCATPRSGDPQ